MAKKTTDGKRFIAQPGTVLKQPTAREITKSLAEYRKRNGLPEK